MAEIHIERKKSVWPWIIALIVVLLLAWGAFALMEDRGGTGYADRPVVTTPANTPATDPASTTTGDAARDTPPPPADDTAPPQQ